MWEYVERIPFGMTRPGPSNDSLAEGIEFGLNRADADPLIGEVTLDNGKPAVRLGRKARGLCVQ